MKISLLASLSLMAGALIILTLYLNDQRTAQSAALKAAQQRIAQEEEAVRLAQARLAKVEENRSKEVLAAQSQRETLNHRIQDQQDLINQENIHLAQLRRQRDEQSQKNKQIDLRTFKDQISQNNQRLQSLDAALRDDKTVTNQVEQSKKMAVRQTQAQTQAEISEIETTLKQMRGALQQQQREQADWIKRRNDPQRQARLAELGQSIEALKTQITLGQQEEQALKETALARTQNIKGLAGSQEAVLSDSASQVTAQKHQIQDEIKNLKIRQSQLEAKDHELQEQTKTIDSQIKASQDKLNELQRFKAQLEEEQKALP